PGKCGDTAPAEHAGFPAWQGDYGGIICRAREDLSARRRYLIADRLGAGGINADDTVERFAHAARTIRREGQAGTFRPAALRLIRGVAYLMGKGKEADCGPFREAAVQAQAERPGREGIVDTR
ncbi:hypothetical protein RZS08_38890, partial [Arthrospira platensis SPKY1]|nr:hypothetical protein [Arthrospira platensis SPKY1]